MKGGIKWLFIDGTCSAFLIMHNLISPVNSQQYVNNASTTGTEIGRPISSANPFTETCLPVLRTITATFPTTGESAWLSSSNRPQSSTSCDVAMRWQILAAKAVETDEIACYPIKSPLGARQSSMSQPFLVRWLNCTFFGPVFLCLESSEVLPDILDSSVDILCIRSAFSDFNFL